MADELTRREREIMDILLKQGEASAEEVRRQLVEQESRRNLSFGLCPHRAHPS